MENHSSKQQLSLSESQSPLLLPSSDSSEKINAPSASEANSDPSTSSTSVNGNNYYVFLSFRGPDTRNGFVDHLYHRLNDEGLKLHPNFVFRDDVNLSPGEGIAENLISAIEHSKVSIPVISENYAASKWCLYELIHIMKCKKSRGQIVLPVLYKVKPSEVRELKGAFGNAFVKAFESCKTEFEKQVKQQGPEALREAVMSTAFESNGPEGKLVKELVQVIMNKRQQDFIQPHPGNLVGIGDHVTKVMNWADTDPSETRIIGIYGIGGIGKTTLATTIYNKLSEKFEYRSFLMDIRETINHKGMEHIQALLSSDITKNHKSRVRDSMTGIGNIQFSGANKKVLILLDDVGHRDHLDKLIDGCNFESGSRIIITCRDKDILKSEYYICELKRLNSEDSMLLFSSYAFEPERPRIELATVTESIVATAGGLPLALKIVGSFLKGKEKSIWEETLQKLSKVPHINVQQKLRISYDSLEYEQQQMFLDIACFFIGTEKKIAAYLWKDLQYCPDSGLERMIKLSLMEIDDNDELRMHDQLRDLGRAIACPAHKKPWKCSRLWDGKAIIIQQSKEENRNIEALRLDKNGSIKFMERESFRRMPYLKFLHLSEVDFARDFGDSLSELRWLEWEMCHDSFNAFNIYLEKLLVLDLSGGSISENWEGWSSIKIKRLKVLNLSRCLNLHSTPKLFAFKNLELLILQGCANLKEIDPSIKDVKRLVSLNLSHCTSLEKLPEQLGKLGELVELDLSWTGIKELPEFIGDLNKLKILGIRGGLIERLPSSIGKLQSLQELDAFGCELKGQILVDKGGLSSLKSLHLMETKISGLPENLDQLASLEHLYLIDCRELESLPKPPRSLSSLWLTCQSNELPSLSHLTNLQELSLHSCESLQSIPELPTCIRTLDVWKCAKLERLPNLSTLSHLKDLQELSLYSCESLQSIPELPSCIQTLDVGRCPKLERLPNLSDLKSLSKLRLIECNGLKQLDGLEALKSLRELELSIFPEYYIRNGLLIVDAQADKVCAIKGLEELGSLEVVNISGRKHIQVLDLSKSEHLKELDVSFCESLVEIRCPSKLLKRFCKISCKLLKKFPDFWSDIL